MRFHLCTLLIALMLGTLYPSCGRKQGPTSGNPPTTVIELYHIDEQGQKHFKKMEIPLTKESVDNLKTPFVIED